MGDNFTIIFIFWLVWCFQWISVNQGDKFNAVFLDGMPRIGIWESKKTVMLSSSFIWINCFSTSQANFSASIYYLINLPIAILRLLIALISPDSTASTMQCAICSERITLGLYLFLLRERTYCDREIPIRGIWYA